MTETEVEQLAASLANRIKPEVPIAVALWDIKAICAYLHRSENYTRTQIVMHSTFPKPIRLPVLGKQSTGQPLWRARDVVQWTENQVQS
jgi:hypothetical protein